MGIVEEILGKKEVDDALKGGIPFKLKLNFRPLRLTSRKNNTVELVADIQNATKETVLTSMVVRVPSGLGLDAIGLNRERELRIGHLKDGEEKTLSVTISGTTNTAPGDYKVDVIVMAHYRDYGHVLNAERKSLDLRVV